MEKLKKQTPTKNIQNKNFDPITYCSVNEGSLYCQIVNKYTHLVPSLTPKQFSIETGIPYPRVLADIENTDISSGKIHHSRDEHQRCFKVYRIKSWGESATGSSGFMEKKNTEFNGDRLRNTAPNFD